jgi:hypothetical protein
MNKQIFVIEQPSNSAWSQCPRAPACFYIWLLITGLKGLCHEMDLAFDDLYG